MGTGQAAGGDPQDWEGQPCAQGCHPNLLFAWSLGLAVLSWLAIPCALCLCLFLFLSLSLPLFLCLSLFLSLFLSVPLSNLTMPSNST